MQLQIFDNFDKQKCLPDLFQTYFNARKNKRNTINALAFEKHFESNLFALHEEIISGKHQPRPSICFIVDKPVKREIFAADFRDRQAVKAKPHDKKTVLRHSSILLLHFLFLIFYLQTHLNLLRTYM